VRMVPTPVKTQERGRERERGLSQAQYNGINISTEHSLRELDAGIEHYDNMFEHSLTRQQTGRLDGSPS